MVLRRALEYQRLSRENIIKKAQKLKLGVAWTRIEELGIEVRR
jgi:hypothetical protein